MQVANPPITRATVSMGFKGRSASITQESGLTFGDIHEFVFGKNKFYRGKPRVFRGRRKWEKLDQPLLRVMFEAHYDCTS